MHEGSDGCLPLMSRVLEDLHLPSPQSEDRPTGKNQTPTFVAERKIDSKRSRHWTVEASPDSHIALQSFEVQVIPTASHFTRVVEQSHIQTQGWHPAELGGHQNAVPVSKAVTGITLEAYCRCRVMEAENRGSSCCHSTWSRLVPAPPGPTFLEGWGYAGSLHHPASGSCKSRRRCCDSHEM